MRSNRKIIFGLLLILGAFGFYRIFRMLSGPGKPTTVATGNTGVAGDPNLRTASLQNSAGRIAKARMTIPANTIVTPDMLRMAPNESTEGFVTDIDSQAAGYITRVTIPEGAPLHVADKNGAGGDFIGHVSETGIAGLLRPGTRAMVIPVANKPTLHDLVRIGNHVDVIGAFDGQESRTLIQDVRVLGVDLSGNDYPNVSVAMRGPFKADPKQGGINSAEGAAVAGAVPAPTGPTPAPTPAANVPRPDPALTLEVTPLQASALQLALASNATLDYLVRPALPGDRSSEIAPLSGDANSPTGEGTLQTVSVTKRQIAPYAESRKTAGNATRTVASTNGNGGEHGNSGGAIRRVREPIGGFDSPGGFPSPLATVAPLKVIDVEGLHKTPSFRPAPTPTQNYTIPVYGDGKILRTETVPLPGPAS